MSVFAEKLSCLHQKHPLLSLLMQSNFEIRGKTFAVQGKTAKTMKVLSLKPFVLYSIPGCDPVIHVLLHTYQMSSPSYLRAHTYAFCITRKPNLQHYKDIFCCHLILSHEIKQPRYI